jgi:hypothetical protein
MNPNIHDFFDQLERVLLVFFVSLLLIFRQIWLVKKLRENAGFVIF